MNPYSLINLGDFFLPQFSYLFDKREKNADWIGTYSDVDTGLGWKFLEDDFTPGAQFTLQLIPGIADDVLLLGLFCCVSICIVLFQIPYSYNSATNLLSRE